MINPLIFDCWASYGPRPAKDPLERWTIDHLLEDLNTARIAGALVRHEQATHYDPMYVNHRLTAEIAPYRDRLFPCWGAMPHQAGDFPEPREFLKEVQDNGIPAIFLTPSTHGYPIDAEILAPLADALSEKKLPILTTLAELGGTFSGAKAFCDSFRHCPVIIAEATWAQWRTMVAIMDACPNTHLEFSTFQANRAVEFFAERYGIERLLLGTDLPRRSAGAARGYADWSLLEDAQVAAFAGTNLATLLGCCPAPLPPSTEVDALVNDSLHGRPLSVPVLDAHCHVLHDGLNGAGSRYVMIKGDCVNMLALAGRMGVDLTAMMSWSGTVSMDVVDGNALIADLVQRFPDRIFGLSSVDPTHQSPEKIVETAEYLHTVLGFRGLKPYTRNNVPYNDPRYGDYFALADRYGLYALLHTAPAVGGIKAVADLADRYPRATFLVAHTGGSWSLSRQVVEIGRDRPNVVAELTYTAALNGVIEWLCEQLGPERVLFGTDAPMRDPRPQLSWCAYSRLSEADKRKIVGRNFADILKRGQLPNHPLPPMPTE